MSSPHRSQAQHLLRGYGHTLGGIRTQPIPTTSSLRSPFVPRVQQLPYSHVPNSSPSDLRAAGLTALRAMVDVEPYDSSEVGSSTSTSSSGESSDGGGGGGGPSDDPDDPHHESKGKGKGKKHKKSKRKHKKKAKYAKEARNVAQSKITVSPPEFTGKDLSDFAQEFARFLRLTGQTKASGRVRCDLLMSCCRTKFLTKEVGQIIHRARSFAEVLIELECQYPSYETDLSLREEILNINALPENPKASRMSELPGVLDHYVGRLTPGSYGADELLFWLTGKLREAVWKECRATPESKARTLTYEDLSVLILELALEREADAHIDAYRPGGRHQRGGGRPGGPTHKHSHANTKNAKFMSTLFYCASSDTNEEPIDADDCTDGAQCLLQQKKKQELNTGTKTTMPDHFRCTVTCAFCGRRKHYEDECNHKKRLSAKLKKGMETGGGYQSGKSGEKGKGKGKGKGQDKKGNDPGGGRGKPFDKKPTPTEKETTPLPKTPKPEDETMGVQTQGQKGEADKKGEMSAGKRKRALRMCRFLQRHGAKIELTAEF